MKWIEPRPARTVLLLIALVLVCLVPFLSKAVHMDDPLFIWTGWQIQLHPLNFYGFTVDWDRTPFPMSMVMDNPPLASYYLALVGTVLGWSEVALHFGFLIPALALVLGTYALASRLCRQPFAATLATVAAPAFILSSTTLMCDISMVAFWVWAVFFWVEGLAREKRSFLFVAAGLTAAASLTKYFAISLVPLLIVYSMLQKRRVGPWLIYFCLPVLALIAYQCWTAKLYGHGLFLNAAAYATRPRNGAGVISKIPTCLAFTGGCVFIVLPSLPLLWGKKGLAVAAAVGAVICLLLTRWKTSSGFALIQDGQIRWPAAIQLAIFICGGIAVLLLAAEDLWQRRSADAWLLFLWVAGTFIFAGVVNWTISGRNILPMAPAVAILLIRRLEPNRLRLFYWPLAVSLGLALLLGWADWIFAETGRQAAYGLAARFPAPAKLGFEGHWGFQYYLEQFGAKPLDQRRLDLSPNEIIIIPLNNTHTFPLPEDRVKPLDDYRTRAVPWLALMNRPTGAGYYSDVWGPAPFLFGNVPDEEYLLLKVQ